MSIKKEVVWTEDFGDLGHLKQMADIATMQRLQSEQVEKELSREDTIKDLTQRILAAAEVKGEPLTHTQAQASVQEYLTNQHTFIEPSTGFETKLAEMYIDRERIVKKRIIPGAAIIGASLMALVGANAIHTSYLEGKERDVEVAVEQIGERWQSLNEGVVSLREETSNGNLPHVKADLLQKLRLAQDQLDVSKGFIVEYIGENETATEKITLENYKVVASQIPTVTEEIDSGFNQIEAGERLVREEGAINAGISELETLLTSIEAQNPPKSLLKRARIVGKSGVANYDSRNIGEGKQNITELREIGKGVKDFTILSSRAEQLYSAIDSISKDPKADEIAKNLDERADVAVENGNIVDLRKVVPELETVKTNLSSEYTVTIVGGTGYKPPQADPGFYVYVKKENAQGNRMSQTIYDKVASKTMNVNWWFEEVSKDAMYHYRADSKADGVLDDTLFGEKKSGYLNMDYSPTLDKFGYTGPTRQISPMTFKSSAKPEQYKKIERRMQ